MSCVLFIWPFNSFFLLQLLLPFLHQQQVCGSIPSVVFTVEIAPQIIILLYTCCENFLVLINDMIHCLAYPYPPCGGVWIFSGTTHGRYGFIQHSTMPNNKYILSIITMDLWNKVKINTLATKHFKTSWFRSITGTWYTKLCMYGVMIII